MKDKEAMEKLATAMEKLADRLEKFQDPILWQKVLSDAVRSMPGLSLLAETQSSSSIEAIPVPRLLPLRLEGVTVRLSDEERDKLVNQVFKAVKPEIAAFSEFVKQSLKDMPDHRLKQISEKVAAGEKLELKRRQGCVFLKAGDEETYLGL